MHAGTAREEALGVSWRPLQRRGHARVLRTSAAGEGGPTLPLMQLHHAPFLQEAVVEAEALQAMARLTRDMTLQSRE